MKKVLFALLLLLMANSCTYKDDPILCCINVDTEISIRYLNQLGDNLLMLENGIDFSQIKIYHKINNVWVEYFEANQDYPKGIRIIERENGKYLSLLPSVVFVEGNYSETKIEFSAEDADIIKTEVNINGSNTTVTKVWYNGVLKWEAYATERMFDIIK